MGMAFYDDYLVGIDYKTGLTSDFNQGSSPLNYLIYFYHNSL